MLEAGRFDGCFFADLFGLYDIHKGGFDTCVQRGGQISVLDPMVVLPLMARATEHPGLGATLTTSFHSAYHLAHVLGSLDLLSKGRVAWKVVTSATDLEARNLGIDALPPKDLRHDIADEVHRGRDFAAQNSQAAMQAFYDDVRGRMATRGRAPAECRILQGLSVVLGKRNRSRARRRPTSIR